MRRAAGIVGVSCALGVTGAAASCGEPTQVLLDVRTNTCARTPTAEITLGRTLPEVESGGKTVATRKGCIGGEDMGTLTILPREGGEDGFVAVRVTASFDGAAPEYCIVAPEKCIVARALAQFERGRTTRTSVFLDDACVGVRCGPGGTCEGGRCVEVKVPPTVDAGGEIEAGSTDGPALDAADANDVACALCASEGGACVSRAPYGDGGAGDAGGPTTTCVLSATQMRGQKTLNCPPGIPCMVTCTQEGACAKVNCPPTVPSCEVTCNGGSDAIPVCDVQCDSPRCRMICAAGARCRFSSVNPTDTIIDCLQSGGCSNVTCGGADCRQSGVQTCRTKPCICTEGSGNVCNGGS